MCVVFNTAECEKIIKNCINSNDFKYIKHTIKPLGNKSGFLGKYRQLEIKIIHKGEKKLLNFFLKCMPSSQFSINFTLEASVFEREIFFLKQFYHETISMGLEEIKETVPECYFAKLNDVIVLEDLNEKEFENFDTRTPYSVAMMNIVMKKLAKFHSASILYEEISGKNLLKNYDEYLKEIFILNCEEATTAQKYFSAGVKGVCEYLIDLFPEIPKEISLEEFKSRVKEAFDVCYEKIKPSNEFKNVLCHGDLWGANILFRKKDGLCIDCRFVDFQIIRYCPPAHDVLLAIYVNTDKNTVKYYLEEFLKTYYTKLSHVVSRYGFNINNILPHTKFLESCKYMKSQVVCQNCVYSEMSMIDSDRITEILGDEEQSQEILIGDRGNFLKNLVLNDGIYEKKMRENLEVLYEMCLNKDYVN